MSHIIRFSHLSLLVAGTALGGMGAVAPITAQAYPMLPLAPACNQWAFPGDVTIREVGTGWDVNFSASGQQAGGRAVAKHSAGQTKAGNLSGSITGDQVSIRVNYDNGQYQGYIGEVGDDAKLHGVTQNNQPNESNIRWDTVFPISCAEAAAPPQKAPPEKAQNIATVESDTDVWTAPKDKGGKQIFNDDGSPLFLSNGEVLTSLEAGCTKETWCVGVNPKIPTAGNKGAVWGGQVTVPAG